jgi:2-keto-4-pentenoate hydratase
MDSNIAPTTNLKFDAVAAAAVLASSWNGDQLDALDPAPRTTADAYAVQHALEDRFGAPAGYKIACTSVEGQEAVGVDEPFVGRLYADVIRDSGCEIPIDSLHLRIIEPELAFEIGEDLPAEAATAPRALAAVKGTYVGIEVPDSRFVDHVALGAPSMIADNGCSGYYVLGPAIDGWPGVHLDETPVTVTVNGELAEEGRGANVLGDPSVAFLWLVRHLRAHGRGLFAGEIISTGTATTPVPVKAGDTVLATYGDLGSVSVNFT